jgi:hypothetical protein
MFVYTGKVYRYIELFNITILLILLFESEPRRTFFLRVPGQGLTGGYLVPGNLGDPKNDSRLVGRMKGKKKKKTYTSLA